MSNAASPPLTIRPLAESGLLVELGDTIAPETTARVMALTAALDAAALPGMRDIVPSYTTILLSFDPTEIEPAALTADIQRLAGAVSAAPAAPGRTVTIPVVYGGGHGTDLALVAAHTGFTAAEVIERHTAADYLVACMGFAPGFAFLFGLPPELTTPRRTDPRTRVPAGSVGIGGAQTGIYPLETPGGWNLIGRTSLRLFDLDRPEPFLLRPGDAVRFAAVSEDGDG